MECPTTHYNILCSTSSDERHNSANRIPSRGGIPKQRGIAYLQLDTLRMIERRFCSKIMQDLFLLDSCPPYPVLHEPGFFSSGTEVSESGRR
mmetsp:Transcript_17666/g.36661  ORF Transcript_17666/g.36661 Transcript_17666/m.36661 type:complete len:92 (-) Transcript_17666:1695-1970(-)